ncbi:MAG: recombinase family protein [Bacteroidales bacterium]|nr:recombinase family protein [Bacteroidales bacterium]
MTTNRSAVIFARTSSSGYLESRQDTTRQVEDLLHYASSNSITIAKVFEEHLTGGKANQDRAILQEAIAYCIDNNTDLILSEISRLGRRCLDILETIKLLRDHHINCYFQKEQLSIFDKAGKENPYLAIMCAVLGTAAELERETIYYRLKSGREKYIRDGGKLGKPKGSGVKTRERLAEEYRAVIRNLKAGQSVRNTAKITGVSPSTVQRLKKEFEL